MATIKKTVVSGQKPTEDQIREVREAAKQPVVFDDDSPELTPAQYAEMAEMARRRRNEQKKPVVAIRITPSTLAKAKATGKGYTGFLSRLLDNAINDPEMVKRSLL